MKIFFSLMFFCFSIYVNAQISEVPKEVKRIKIGKIDTLRGWSDDGRFSININQTYYDNWVSGGNGNIDLQTEISKKIRYKNKKIIWDNYVNINYGLNKIYGQEIQKTKDRVEINSIFGGNLPNKWSYSFFVNFQTQIHNSYLFKNDEDKIYRISGFLAPAYLAMGPGVMWRKKENLRFNIAPLTSKSVYINGEVFKYNKSKKIFESNKDVSVFGVPKNEVFENKLGFYASAFYKLKLWNNMSVENRLALYSNYLKDFGNIDLNYEMQIRMKINKYVSTNISLSTFYDDDAFKGFQFKESFGVGIDVSI